MEKILRIEQGTFEAKQISSYGMIEGYQIITDKQTIILGIENGQSCCEDWGYMLSNDTPDEFIGAELNSIHITDRALKDVEVPNVYEGCIMFVNIETSKGTLQFVAYNDHNGYYGHEAGVVSIELTHSESL